MGLSFMWWWLLLRRGRERPCDFTGYIRTSVRKNSNYSLNYCFAHSCTQYLVVRFVGLLYIETDGIPYTGQRIRGSRPGRIWGSRPRRASGVLIYARIRAHGRKGARIYGRGRTGRIWGAPGVPDVWRIMATAAGRCNYRRYNNVVTVVVTIPL